jgi:hypothetical protein
LQGKTSLTLVLQNFIGTKANGTGDLGNRRDGIYIRDAHNNFIGGTIPNSGNIIAYNGASNVYHGVEIYGDTALNNAIRGNSIHDHLSKGIALTGLSNPPNDLDDVDTGQNNLQNSPAVTAAINSNGMATGSNSSSMRNAVKPAMARARPISAPPASRPAVTTQLSAWPFRASASAR